MIAGGGLRLRRGLRLSQGRGAGGQASIKATLRMVFMVRSRDESLPVCSMETILKRVRTKR